MDNFTPLKEVKAKKKVNKFFLVGNLVLFLTIIAVGVYYVNTTKFPYKGKANEFCVITANSIAVNSANCNGNTRISHLRCGKKADQGVYPGNSCVETTETGCFSRYDQNCGREQLDAYNQNLELCGILKIYPSDCEGGPTRPPNLPTNTPTPTGTPVITNTPTATPIITNTPTPTPTPTNTPTPTGTPVITNTPTATPTNTPTPVSVACGTKDCDSATNPCQSGFVCIQSTNGSNYCSVQAYVSACQANPSYNSCCTAPGAPTATPTETILAKVTPTVAKLLQTGVVKSFMYFIPAAIMLLGLIL